MIINIIFAKPIRVEDFSDSSTKTTYVLEQRRLYE